MSGLFKPTVALITLFFAATIIISFLPPTVTRPGYDQGCSCHNQGIEIYINQTDVNTLYGFYVPSFDVKSGQSFFLNITTQRTRPIELIPPTMTWLANRSDTERFMFDPQEVRDNSPQDRDLNNGRIVAIFRITAPKEPGSYSIALYAQGPILSIEVRVTRPIQYDVTISLAGLPTSSQTTLLIDGKKVADVKGGESKIMTYPTGTSHGVQVDQYVDGTAGYRYYCASNSWVASDEGSKVFEYTTQVRLDVSTEPSGVTNVTASGWFLAGSSVSISSVPVEVQDAKGTKYVFAGWTVDGAPRTDNGFTIVMDLPHEAVAKFERTTAISTTSLGIYVGGGAAIVLLAILLLWRKTRSSTTKPSPIPPR